MWQIHLSIRKTLDVVVQASHVFSVKVRKVINLIGIMMFQLIQLRLMLR